MRISTIIASAGLLCSAAAGVVRRADIPTANGFPTPNQAEEQKIALQAGGKLPGGGLPTNLGPASTTSFQLIAFNELFETAYFNSLLNNITNKAPGYEVSGNQLAGVQKIVSTILAQEEQHAIGALATLKSAHKFAPSACKYQFPVTNLQDAISLAETFTAVVLGALQNANVAIGKEGGFPLVRLLSSVIGQEGEQNGYYRNYLNQVPSESPFLTTVPPAFAWSALQLFVVPGSCPFNLNRINLPIFPPLSVNGGPIAKINPTDQTLNFQANLKNSKAAREFIGKKDGLFITYTTGQQLPISVKAENVHWKGDVVTLQAKFPFTENVMQGFSHAALTTGDNIKDADSVVAKTLAAPGVIQVANQI
ncbi:hypothetical protein BGZ63DRAFT_511980 [Mariannaea sp. PMI_226]|nr:hypothetical protein BGZ63DRAFT_511980 [Mariannaea sp. PMI_226]